MNRDIVELQEDVSQSPLYSEDLAPVPPSKRTWTKWNLAAIWVGMAVCIPTYLLASYMIKTGLSWIEALIIIGVANLIITAIMLNAHAGSTIFSTYSRCIARDIAILALATFPLTVCTDSAADKMVNKLSYPAFNRNIKSIHNITLLSSIALIVIGAFTAPQKK